MTAVVEVSDRWFDVESLSDGISLIREPHVAAFIRANIWHVRGRDRDLLIDTGLGVRSLRNEIPRLTERPVVCVSTHCHFDHCGGLHEFDERLGHILEAHVYAAPTARKTASDRFLSERSFTRLPHPGYQPMTYAMRAAPLTRCVDDGAVIDLGNRVLHVMHLPGHTSGHIGLWEPRTGLLFSGDAIYDGTLVDNDYERGPEEYRETMSRLRRMPVNLVHAGHKVSFGRTRMIQIIDEYIAGLRPDGCPNEK